jgi:hypothetical protein
MAIRHLVLESAPAERGDDREAISVSSGADDAGCPDGRPNLSLPRGFDTPRLYGRNPPAPVSWRSGQLGNHPRTWNLMIRSGSANKHEPLGNRPDNKISRQK